MAVGVLSCALPAAAGASYRGVEFVVQLTRGSGTYENSATTANACDTWSYSDQANFSFHDRFPHVFIAPAIRSLVNGVAGAPTGSVDGSFTLTDNFHAGCPDESPSSITCPGDVGAGEEAGGPAPLTTAAELHYRGTPSGIDVQVSPSDWAAGNDTYASCPSYTDSWLGNNGLGGPFMLLDGRLLPGFGPAWGYTYFGARVHIPLRVLNKKSFHVDIGMSADFASIPASGISALNQCNAHGSGQTCSIAYSWQARLTFTRVCAANIRVGTDTVDTTDVKEQRAYGKCA